MWTWLASAIPGAAQLATMSTSEIRESGGHEAPLLRQSPFQCLALGRVLSPLLDRPMCQDPRRRRMVLPLLRRPLPTGHPVRVRAASTYAIIQAAG